MTLFLDFEKPIAELEGKINELRHLSNTGEMNIVDEISRLESKAEKLLQQAYANLTPWQKVQVARHPDRPQFLDYVTTLIQDFTPLAGDKLFGEDPAIIGGLGRLDGRAVMIIGQHRGHDTESRLKHNFGLAKPEGYRKAQRLMKLADRFNIPVITFIDTNGAFPGIEAEERGQAEAIARSIETCLRIQVPLVTVVLGEGGSGGAIAIGVGNTVLMLEHAIYSVITPEGCASILWRSATKAPEASEALRFTAQDLKQFDVIDEIIKEPVGGAHRHKDAVIREVGAAVSRSLNALSRMDGRQLIQARRDRFLKIGG